MDGIPTPSKKRRGDSSYTPPLAGNVSVSLTPGGLPLATLTHPLGGSCQLLIPGASVSVWRSPDGVERLAPSDDTSGACSPCGLAAWVPPEAWAIERLDGGQGPDDSVRVSVFAEAPGAGGVPAFVRVTVTLLPHSLSVGIEVANELEAGDASLPVDCTLRLRCAAAAAAPVAVASAEEALDLLGMGLRLQGFAGLELVAADEQRLRCIDVVAEPRVLLVGPGETLSGAVSLELRNFSAAT